MALIKLTESIIVNTSEILTITRCGNYTDIVLRNNNQPMQIWDENKEIWNLVVSVVAIP